jgi:thiol-disulfide isomerase/thioredoxin
MVRFVASALALAASLLSISAYGEQVLLDFWSPTCGPCMQMKPTVQSLISAGYPIRQVDVSREPQLAQQYQVTGIPCFVMLEDGQEVGRIVGSTSANKLVELFRGGRVRGQSPQQHEIVPSQTEQPNYTPPAPGGLHASGPAGPSSFGQPPAAIDSPADDSTWTQQFDGKLLSCSVRLKVTDAQGVSYGTGTIIDARDGAALLITCGHIFRDSQGKGPITVEVFEAGPNGLRVVDTVSGHVINYDLERDVALVSFRPSNPVCVAPVAAPRTVTSRGDRAATVGCSHGEDPSVIATRITWLDRYQSPPNIEASGAPVNGRSGGGLFNDKGELIGICIGAEFERNEGMYAALESIHESLRVLKLGGLDVASTDGTPGSDVAADTVVRGQEPPASMAPMSQPPAELDAETESARPLDPKEQAAFEEIRKRLAAGYEVVCIVRPKEPGGQSEVITLDGVSSDFIQAIADQPGTTKTR